MKKLIGPSTAFLVSANVIKRDVRCKRFVVIKHGFEAFHTRYRIK